MLNGEINEFTVDSELTQVASYFNIVDNLVRTGDTNKKYVVSTQQCQASATPFDIGGWTTIPLSPQGQNMVDLYNSFMTVDLKIGAITGTTNKDPFPKITNGENTTDITDSPFNHPALWFGFKDSANIVGQYQLIANGQTFYTQSFAIEESYITSLATTEAVKHVDVFSKAIHEDIWKGKNTSRTGVIVDYANKADDKLIHLKIDFRRFLPLATIKYVPEFIGNLQMRIRFSIDGLVVAPLGLDYICAGNQLLMSKVTMANGITNKFVPYGALATNDASLYGITAATYASNALTLTVGNIGAQITGKVVIDKCQSHLACFGVDQNIYNQIAGRYLHPNPALSFPIQTLSFHQMNGTLKGTGKDYTPTLTITPRYVDSIFIIFPKTSDYHTCYDNITAKSYQLKMGGNGTFPDITHETWSPEFLEITSNVFNVNNDLTGFSPDVVESLVNHSDNVKGFYSKDTSNFILAVPTSTDNTFQQGQTSNTPITYQLHLQLDNASPFINKETCTPVMCFLKDSVLAIQLQTNGAPPIVTLDEYDIASPA